MIRPYALTTQLPSAAVAVRVNAQLQIPDGELEWSFTPSGGPGGQHANRANTRVELRWSVADSAVLSPSQRERLLERLGPLLAVTVDSTRSQQRNRDLAIERLGDRVRQGLHRPKTRRDTRPSAASRRRRVEGKRKRSETKRLRRRPGEHD